MKKFIFSMIGLMGIIMLGSCDKDSVYDESATVKYKGAPKDTTTVTPPPTPTPKDTTSTSDWGTPVKNNLIPVGEPTATSHMWNAVQVFYNGKGDSLVRRAEVPFGYELTPAKGFSSAKTTEPARYTGMSATSANSTNTTYGEWFKDMQGNTLRKITNFFEVRTSEFNKTLTVSHFEGYSTVNGRDHSFKSPAISAAFKSLSVTDSTEVTRGDSIFMQRTYMLIAIAKFHISSMNIKNYEVSATHVVESFVRVKEEKKDDESMPPADLYVGKLISATDVVASPIWAGSEKISRWAKTSLVEDETVYHMWVDGRFVGDKLKSELAGTNYNAVMLDGDKYVPCLCQKKDGGLNYAVEYADGSYKIHTVDENLALSSGLKNFTKNDVAAQTPFVKTIKESKTYNGKAWLKLTCYNVDGKPTLSYTVAEK
jgi:hypothetical protein